MNTSKLFFVDKIDKRRTCQLPRSNAWCPRDHLECEQFLAAGFVSYNDRSLKFKHTNDKLLGIIYP